MLEVVKNNLDNSACGDLSTLDRIEKHFHDSLSIQAAFNLVQACLESLESHLADNELAITMSTVVDQEGVNLFGLGT